MRNRRKGDRKNYDYNHRCAGEKHELTSFSVRLFV